MLLEFIFESIFLPLFSKNAVKRRFYGFLPNSFTSSLLVVGMPMVNGNGMNIPSGLPLL